MKTLLIGILALGALVLCAGLADAGGGHAVVGAGFHGGYHGNHVLVVNGNGYCGGYNSAQFFNQSVLYVQPSYVQQQYVQQQDFVQLDAGCSCGGVQGASYIAPTGFVVRPRFVIRRGY